MVRKVRLYEYQGETKPLSAWSRQIGVPLSTLRGRLRRGWDFAALLSAQEQLDDRLTYKGDTATIETWFRRLGLDPKILRRRLASGSTVKKALLLPRLRRSTHPHARQVQIDGQSKTIAEWAAAKGLNKRALRYRLDSGWLPQFAIEVK